MAQMPNDVINEIYHAGYMAGYDEGYQAAIPRWIPATERLPEDGVKVICISKNGRVSDCDCLNSYVTKLGNYDMTTHWMPLPEPPKAEEGE